MAAAYAHLPPGRPVGSNANAEAATAAPCRRRGMSTAARPMRFHSIRQSSKRASVMPSAFPPGYRALRVLWLCRARRGNNENSAARRKLCWYAAKTGSTACIHQPLLPPQLAARTGTRSSSGSTARQHKNFSGTGKSRTQRNCSDTILITHDRRIPQP